MKEPRIHILFYYCQILYPQCNFIQLKKGAHYENKKTTIVLAVCREVIRI